MTTKKRDVLTDLVSSSLMSPEELEGMEMSPAQEKLIERYNMEILPLKRINKLLYYKKRDEWQDEYTKIRKRGLNALQIALLEILDELGHKAPALICRAYLEKNYRQLNGGAITDVTDEGGIEWVGQGGRHAKPLQWSSFDSTLSRLR